MSESISLAGLSVVFKSIKWFLASFGSARVISKFTTLRERDE